MGATRRIVALKCSNRTQRDAVRRNPAAWHAEGRGSNPLSSTGYRAVLVSANLNRADLRDATLPGADLAYADFRDAILLKLHAGSGRLERQATEACGPGPAAVALERNRTVSRTVQTT